MLKLTIISPSVGIIERVEIGSLPCQQEPSCRNSQELLSVPSGALSKHTSLEATPTPQIPAEACVLGGGNEIISKKSQQCRLTEQEVDNNFEKKSMTPCSFLHDTGFTIFIFQTILGQAPYKCQSLLSRGYFGRITMLPMLPICQSFLVRNRKLLPLYMLYI